MIEVKGQYIFSASIDDIEDFISVTNLIHFSIEERCGNSPPNFKLEFRSDIDKILSRLTQNYPIKIQFGETLEDYEEIDLYIVDYSFNQDGEQTAYSIDGLAFEPDYTVATKMFISGQTSGIQAISQKVEGYCQTKFNTTASFDTQRWIQPNITDRNFINNVISHSYTPDSFFISAISSDRKFIIKDVKKEAIEKADNADWLFTHTENEKNAVPYAGNYGVRVSNGLMMSLVGYGREKVITELTSGNTALFNQLPKPYLALTREIARKASIESKFTGAGIKTENMHQNYHKAYLNFIVNNIMMGAITISTTFDDKYRKLKPADWVMFKTPSKTGTIGASEYISGFYIVSTVKRSIRDGDLGFEVTLSRECFNRLKA